ncbi:GTP 3',8-cyclase MoaA [Oceanobacter mangrovi]|uniref:GTP 3',8-cyclase MoaA n=1 Tax=Oceanobacter mangrovi TaxID=2862510 RepID=UPI001C8EBE43|nr:GTP 3',8-cyclase MoaA [Oceanobacter mangrovi]
MTHKEPGLQDRFGRQFSYLRLSITDVCNFRCSYCLPDGYQKQSGPEPLQLDEIQRLLAVFAQLGTRKVRITGGEPSVRKDLTEIIQLAANTDGIDQVALTTNGYKLAENIAAWHAAGLQQLNVSIDSLDAERFQQITGYSHLARIIEGIDQALALGLKVKVNAVLLKGFDQTELALFENWLKQTPVSVRFIELMQTGDQPVFFSEHHVRGEAIRQQLLDNGWSLRPRQPHDGPALEFSHPDYQGRFGLIMPYSKDFCSSCNRLRISSLGKLHLCLFGDQGHDLRQLLDGSHTSDELAAELQHLLGIKSETHYLHAGETGAMRHFAMLGG